MTTYTIAIKHDDDTMHPATNSKFQGLDLDTAERHMERIWISTHPDEGYAGVAILDNTGNIYSEMEW
jgi:hypothetical protein